MKIAALLVGVLSVGPIALAGFWDVSIVEWHVVALSGRHAVGGVLALPVLACMALVAWRFLLGKKPLLNSYSAALGGAMWLLVGLAFFGSYIAATMALLSGWPIPLPLFTFQ